MGANLINDKLRNQQHSLNDAINQGYEAFCTYSNEMLSGRHELNIKEYEEILLAQEMYARGAEFVME